MYKCCQVTFGSCFVILVTHFFLNIAHGLDFLVGSATVFYEYNAPSALRYMSKDKAAKKRYVMCQVSTRK